MAFTLKPDRPSQGGGRRSLQPGALAATMTFFEDETEKLDVATIRAHAVRLAEAGLAGLVVLGSNGEAPHLNNEERMTVTRATRAALDEAGFNDLPLIVGASDASVRGTLQLCHEAAAAGGDYVLVLPPSYFRGAMTYSVIADFYARVADALPLPIIIYSFPAVVAGINMDSDLLIAISQHQNVVGTKFTCGDTGKLARVARAMNAKTPTATNSEYLCYGGLADFALMALVARGSGFIAGGANIMPKACVRIVDLFKQDNFYEAMKEQKKLSDGDWYHTKAGVAGTKSVLQSSFGYGGPPRLPLVSHSTNDARALMENMREVLAWESNL
ncbi:hypothetical protein LCI18_014392 [Fusarium solani-melongenae]|uniref:Uncharacterized protein n=1 Tax=Fusarium solani subsp. cucurbitae TaxID=2747967 RepID=A0ACD3ZQG8_FUSSC|nr:hypothetical protein LCI18_014392 [Fusarium solani-melongenae]